MTKEYKLSAGSFRDRFREDVIETIKNNGGTVVDTVTSNVHYVLTCEDMAHVMENPYKLQFYPKLKEQIESYVILSSVVTYIKRVHILIHLICTTIKIRAQMYNIPIVDIGFIDECITYKRLVDVDSHKIPQFIVVCSANIL